MPSIWLLIVALVVCASRTAPNTRWEKMNLVSDNLLLKLFGIEHPIIQGPLGGGPSTPELVAAVSNAGGLGSLGAAYMTPEQITAAIRRIRSLTSLPFSVNLFVGAWSTNQDFD